MGNSHLMRTTRLASRHRGFSLMELIVALGISMVLMGALASIFAQSVSTREKIDKEGRKIETARYSLDILAEDIRLAGYYGNYVVPMTGSSPADWKYVDPWSTTGGAPVPGWNPTSSPVEVPFPIFGYEAHGTGTLPTSLVDSSTGALPNYKSGTDVVVLRRASTTTVAASTAGTGDPYLQVSSCPLGTVDTQPFQARATTTASEFNMHLLGCTATTAGTAATARKLITRIYYIASCDDCTANDGIPSLKMVELGMNSGSLKLKENLRTIAPGVEDMHLEYGIDTSGDGAVDAYVISNENPRSTGTTGTAVTGMRTDAGGENRWEDVVSVKLFLVTRDLTSTQGYTDTKTFEMGTKSKAAANDAYRRRLMSSTIKLVNMSARREVP